MVTRHAEYVPPSDSESDPESEVEELKSPPLHSSRSTMGRRQVMKFQKGQKLVEKMGFIHPPNLHPILNWKVFFILHHQCQKHPMKRLKDSRRPPVLNLPYVAYVAKLRGASPDGAPRTTSGSASRGAAP